MFQFPCTITSTVRSREIGVALRSVASQNYANKLNAIYSKYNITADQFSCRCFEKCTEYASKAKRPLDKNGAEAHIGSRYGETLKIVVVSMDTGGDAFNISDRTDQIENKSYKKETNKHMRGTRELLECLYHPYNPSKINLYMLFAMVNAVKCSGSDSSMKSLPKSVYINCFPYLKSEVLGLEPDLVVVQGHTVKSLFGGKHMHSLPSSLIQKAVATATADKPMQRILVGIAEAYLMDLDMGQKNKVLTLFTPHPSTPNGSWQVFAQTAMYAVSILIDNILERRGYDIHRILLS